MNWRLNIVLLAIVAVLAGWYMSFQDSDRHSLDHLIKKDDTADYTGNQMSTSVFDLEGKPQYYAEAEQIKRYENTELTEFFKPLVNLFNKASGAKQWKISADFAQIKPEGEPKENILQLSGSVKLEALDPTSRLQKIETDKLTVNLNTQDIATESAVKSTGAGFTTTGTGLKGNLKQQVATLLNDVKSYIEPTVINPKNEQNKQP